MLNKLISVLLLFGCSFCLAAEKADFYVAVDGLDSNEGSEAAPFRTLDRARLAVRVLKQTNSKPIKVWVRGGHYEVEKTIVFDRLDSGKAGAEISYAAYPGEVPVLSAGTKISQWRKPVRGVPGLPIIAKGKVVVSDVKKSFRALFDENGILQRARSTPFITKEGGTKEKVLFPEGVVKNYSQPSQLELWVRPHHAWIVNILPLESFNASALTAHPSIRATYPMNPLHFLKTTDNAWIENAIEELDEPGEWVYDETRGRVYLWPRGESSVYSARLNEIIKLEGEIDFDGSVDLPVTHLSFSGLTFKHGERYQISSDDAGLQHDWEMLDKDNALVRLRGTEQCSIKDCHFLHSGSGAVRIDLHGQENEVSGCHIEHIGGTGILVAGYGPGVKDVNHHNRILNNHIHHVGEIYWHAPGVMISQSGQNRIANNYIHHTNYTGLIISGCVVEFFTRSGRESSKSVRQDEIENIKNITTFEQAKPYLHTHDNLIELNEISHAMQKLGDGNAIYIRGCGSHNIIRKNYIHHLISPMIMQCAIRTDGGQQDTIVRENIIYKCTSQGMMLKLNTKFENNIIADVIYPPRGYYLSLREGPLTGATLKRNIFYSSELFEEFVNELDGKRAGGTEDRRGRKLALIEDIDTAENIFFCKSHPRRSRLFLQTLEKRESSNGSLAIDPLFNDPQNGDFSFKENSPAIKMGFIPINQELIGLLK